MTVKKQNNKVISIKKIVAVAVAACVALAVGLFGLIYYNNNLAVASIIDIDVNPSVELTTNKQDKVLSVEAINEDGKAILGDMDLRNTQLDIAVNAVIGAMVKAGYLKGADNEILISVKHDDELRAQELKKQIAGDIDASLESHNVESALINQTINKENLVEQAKVFSEKQGISIGKANFVLKLAEKDKSLNAEELANQSLKEIASIVSEKKLDISDIAELDPDDSIWENIADTVEDINEQESEKSEIKPSNNDVISKKKAREIALKDAGISESNAFFVKENLDSEKGKKIYEIEFYHNNTEYDYEIDANSGKIISSDLDIEDYEIPKPDKKPVASANSANSSSSAINAESAKKLALSHADVKPTDAKFSKTELDRDDGRKYYDVEFKANGYEYDYEIDAISGEIIKSDKEKDDDYIPSSKPSSSKITKSEAENAAFKHAGVKKSDIHDLSVEYDSDDGAKFYEIEFKVNNVEYSYEINAADGAVIDFEKEIDD